MQQLSALVMRQPRRLNDPPGSAFYALRHTERRKIHVRSGMQDATDKGEFQTWVDAQINVSDTATRLGSTAPRQGGRSADSGLPR